MTANAGELHATGLPRGALQPSGAVQRPSVGRATAIAAVLALVVAAIVVALDVPYSPGSPLGYTLGLTGALMMLALLLYPLRKSWTALRSWGLLKYWFRLHMFLGITGPVLVLFHSTFRFGSMNAGVALGSMLLVAGSGVVGRFLYARIHSSLYGNLSTLEQMQAEREKSESRVRRLFELVPAVEPLLERHASLAQPREASAAARAWSFATLGWRTWRTWRKCRTELQRAMKAQSRERRWTRSELRARHGAARALVRVYLTAAQRAAQFRTYDRLFSLWHTVHIPFVYILAASAIVHVIAVHMY
jgi:hypothetical protein